MGYSLSFADQKILDHPSTRSPVLTDVRAVSAGARIRAQVFDSVAHEICTFAAETVRAARRVPSRVIETAGFVPD
jgi:hypothetical protein